VKGDWKMEKIKYRATDIVSPKVEKVTITKETEHFVIMGNRRGVKRSEFHNYFDSFQEAEQYLIDKQVNKINSHKERERILKEKLAIANKLEEEK
jgi:hypothetical protein